MVQPSISLKSNLLPGSYYYITHESIEEVNLFYRKCNYDFFLMIFRYYLDPFLDLYAWQMEPNKIQLLVRIKKEKETEFQGEDLLVAMTHGFRKAFMRYAKAINRQQGRTGSLFKRKFSRIKIKRRDVMGFARKMQKMVDFRRGLKWEIVSGNKLVKNGKREIQAIKKVTEKFRESWNNQKRNEFPFSDTGISGWNDS